MAKKSKKKELSEFEARLAQLASDYGIMPSAIVVSQITDLAEDLSGESVANVFALIGPVCEDIATGYTKFGGKPNVITDGKIKNALQSFSSKSPEYALVLLRTLVGTHMIQLKNENIIPSDVTYLIEDFLFTK